MLEREGPPSFDAVVQILDRDHWEVHEDVMNAVDSMLRGAPVEPQLRVRASDGGVAVLMGGEAEVVRGRLYAARGGVAGDVPASLVGLVGQGGGGRNGGGGLMMGGQQQQVCFVCVCCVLCVFLCVVYCVFLCVVYCVSCVYCVLYAYSTNYPPPTHTVCSTITPHTHTRIRPPHPPIPIPLWH